MKIILVEDEIDLGQAIKKTLIYHKYIVDWVSDGHEAWDYLENPWSEYTLGIFDWLVPGLSGVELIQKLRGKNNPLPVLMLTAKDSMEDKIQGLDAGADDYLVKPFETVELLARLRSLQRRSPQLQPQQITVGYLTLDYNTRSVYFLQSSPQKIPISLTNKEFQLLEYLMRHPQQIITTDQIKNQLWEVGSESFSNVVAAQVRLLRRKLEPFNCAYLIETVHGVGYRFKYESK